MQAAHDASIYRPLLHTSPLYCASLALPVPHNILFPCALPLPCSCTEPGSVDQTDLADTPPLQFIAGVAGDLQFPDERAISMATNWVAGHCRSRIVEVRGSLLGVWLVVNWWNCS